MHSGWSRIRTVDLPRSAAAPPGILQACSVPAPASEEDQVMNSDALSNNGLPRQLAPSLLLLRWGMVVFLAPWIVDKFRNPAHAIGVFEHFYGLGGIAQALVYGIGVAQVLIVACFALGIARRWSYGLVLLMHAGSTLSSWRQYLDPFDGANLLFFAAWPALAACIALYLLRDHDTLGTFGRRRSQD